MLDKNHSAQLRRWIGDNMFSATLLYRATRDGFAAATFHKNCDNRGPTAVIIKAFDGNIFGGYAGVSWDSSHTFKHTSDCFLFSLVNKVSQPPTKFEPVVNANTMLCLPNYGPTFGTGYDLHICNRSNDTNASYSKFPVGFKDTTAHGRNIFNNSVSGYFTTVEIEVFKINLQQ